MGIGIIGNHWSGGAESLVRKSVRRNSFCYQKIIYGFSSLFGQALVGLRIADVIRMAIQLNTHIRVCFEQRMEAE